MKVTASICTVNPLLTAVGRSLPEPGQVQALAVAMDKHTQIVAGLKRTFARQLKRLKLQVLKK